jgi:RHS repeat-associated protein
VVSEQSNPEGRKLQWLVHDQLGTPRMIFDTSGRLHDDPATTSIVEGVRRHDYLAFGEENVYNAAGGSRTAANGYVTDGVRQQFTGHERDSETGLDFMQARYYASGQGRFTSPDEILIDQVKIAPQSWNLYSYVRNNPILNTDPTGRYTCGPNGVCVGDWDGERNGSMFWNESKHYWESYRERKLRLDSAKLIRHFNQQEAMRKKIRESNDPNGKMAAAGVAIVRSPKIHPAANVAVVVAVLGYTAITWNHLPAPITIGTTELHKPSIPAPPLIINPNINARKPDLELVDAISEQYDIPRDLLSEEVHEYKRKTGRRGNDNLGKEKIREIAEEIKSVLESSRKPQK